MRFQQVLGCALALVTTFANAQNATFCAPGASGICYAVNVAADASKDLFFQISAPSSMAWVGLGQGSGMSGSNIFVIYANAAGTNVTLSPRLGTGYQEPMSDTSAVISLLGGSMISNGMMVANVKCSNCQSWNGGSMDLTSATSSWIYAYKTGSALSSDSISASIDQHDKYGTFSLNLASATGGDGTVNPFTTTVSASNTGMTSLNGADPPTNSTALNSTTTDAPVPPSDAQMIMDGTTAHGIMGAAAFVVLFPSGSIVMRIFNFRGLIWLHVGLQVVGYLVALALMETGVWIAIHEGEMMNTHPILGLIVVCGLFFQPFLGIGHHVLFKRKGGPNALTYPHIWWGRILITIGIINGYLGLQLSHNTTTIEVAYAVVAGLIWLVWMGLALLTFLRGRGSEPAREKPRIRRVNSYD